MQEIRIQGPDHRKIDRHTDHVILFDGRMQIGAGAAMAESGTRIAGPMKRGLKVAVLLAGRQVLRLDGGAPHAISGPAMVLASNAGDHLQERTFLTDELVSFALVQIAPEFAETELELDLDRIGQRLTQDSLAPTLAVHPVNAALRRLVLQMNQPPFEGAMRRLFMAGKAMELVATALAPIETDQRPASSQAVDRTTKQIYCARDMLLEAPGDPPSLAELARASGLNVTKLTIGFRRVFGTTVFGYLQEHRLQMAHALILSGEKTVSEAAFQVGYNPSHFSVIFRKRFGVPPSALR